MMYFNPLRFNPGDTVYYKGRQFSVLGYDEWGRVALVDDESNILYVRESKLL